MKHELTGRSDVFKPPSFHSHSNSQQFAMCTFEIKQCLIQRTAIVNGKLHNHCITLWMDTNVVCWGIFKSKI